MLETLLIVIGCFIGLPTGLVLLVLMLFVLMPIHIGGSGFYRDDTYGAHGWAKALGGLLGVHFEYTELGGQVQVRLAKWAIWTPQQEADEQTLKEEQPEATKPALPTEVDVSERKSSRDDSGAQLDVQKPIDGASDAEKYQSAIKSPGESDTHAGSSKSADLSGEGQEPTELPDDEPETTHSFWAQVRKVKAQIRRYLDYWEEAQPILFRFLKRLLRVFGFRYVDIDVTYGASDPAQTGRLFGYIEALRPLLGKKVVLVLNPDFTRSRLEGAGALEVSFYLSRLLWSLLALVIRGGILGGKIWWRERKVKKEIALT